MGKKKTKVSGLSKIFGLCSLGLVVLFIVLYVVNFLTISNPDLNSLVDSKRSATGFQVAFALFALLFTKDVAKSEILPVLREAYKYNSTMTIIYSLVSFLALVFAVIFIVMFILNMVGIAKKSNFKTIALYVTILLSILTLVFGIVLGQSIVKESSLVLGNILNKKFLEVSFLCYIPMISILLAGVCDFLSRKKI